MKIILSGGGTGGHIYPALAIASEIKTRIPDAELLYVGTEKGLESQIVPDRGIPIRTIDISGIDRSSWRKAGKSLVKFPFSFFQARDIIKEFQPDVIIGTGGYVSYPIVLAGTFFGTRTVIHEQNAIPGLANKSLANRVDHVLLTFEEAQPYIRARKITVTGLPVRKEILEVNRDQAFERLQLDQNRFTLLAFGGSLGANSINRAMMELVDRLQKDDIQIVWITGNEHYAGITEKLAAYESGKSTHLSIQVFPYLYHMEDALAVADLAVCRAGASTISELEMIGLPAILVPFPYAADNHQEKNARALLQKNAADMVIDEFLDGDTLLQKVNSLRTNRERLAELSKNMKKESRPNALKEIVDIVLAGA